VRLEARGAQSPIPAVTIRDLIKVSLRLRPDWILFGELHGGEAFVPSSIALNTGQADTLATLHANSAGQAIALFTICILHYSLSWSCHTGRFAATLPKH
jgi:Flp pilus assembly CpaF family ATPase